MAVVDNLIAFGRVLRSRGLEVHVGRLLDVINALPHIDIASRDDVYWTCRALLVHRHDDLAGFDAAFNAFWQSRDLLQRPDAPMPRETAAASHSEQATPRDGSPDGSLDGVETAPVAVGVQTWSDVEAIADKDFADFTEDEVALAASALNQLVWTPDERRIRRWKRGSGPLIDLRRALSRSVRTGGDVVSLPRRRRRTRPRPVVLLCDVSGSMERYSRMLLYFVHAMGMRHRRFEAFVFSTRLTRVTRQVRGRSLGQAVAAVSRAVPDWSGGTRIGDALRTFHQRWARIVLQRAPVVLLVSDGWDRGDPAALREGVARLQRSCHRLIWLNPLIGTSDYAPLTRGLVAALPFVDDFLPARTLTNLRDLAVHLNALDALTRHR